MASARSITTLPPTSVPVRRSRALDLVAFVLGFLSFWYVDVVGQLYVIEMLTPILLLLLFPRKHQLLFRKPVVTILLLGLLWLGGQIATDLYRNTPWADLARGWAAIIIFLMLFASFVQLVSDDVRRMYLLLFGAGLGGTLQQFLQPSPFFEVEPWKFGFGPPFALLLISWIGCRFWKKGRMSVPWIATMLVFGVLSIYLNARSLGGFVVLSALVMWFRGTPSGRRLAMSKLGVRQFIVLGVVTVLFAASILKGYEVVVAQGWLGEQALRKFEMQSTGNLGLIIGGRIESLASVPAVIDSPFIGHGSWAKDPQYRWYLLELLNLGYDRSENQLLAQIEKRDLIPTHSHLLQAWVWAGVLGAVFWIYIAVLIVRVLVLTFRHPNPVYAPVLFLGLEGLWHILFSPFGSMMRFNWALVLTVNLLALRFLQRNNHERRGTTAIR